MFFCNFPEYFHPTWHMNISEQKCWPVKSCIHQSIYIWNISDFLWSLTCCIGKWTSLLVTGDWWPYWFKVGFSLNFLGNFFHVRFKRQFYMRRDLTHTRSDWTSKNSKYQGANNHIGGSSPHIKPPHITWILPCVKPLCVGCGEGGEEPGVGRGQNVKRTNGNNDVEK